MLTGPLSFFGACFLERHCSCLTGKDFKRRSRKPPKESFDLFRRQQHQQQDGEPLALGYHGGMHPNSRLLMESVLLYTRDLGRTFFFHLVGWRVPAPEARRVKFTLSRRGSSLGAATVVSSGYNLAALFGVACDRTFARTACKEKYLP